jgi:PAS domain S-box-containing protein
MMVFIPKTLPDGSVSDCNDTRRLYNNEPEEVVGNANSVILRTPEDLTVLVNSQTEKLFGYPHVKLLGQKVKMLVPERYRNRHPSHRPGLSRQTANPLKGCWFGALSASQGWIWISSSRNRSQSAKNRGGLLVSSAIRDITEREWVEGIPL